MVVASRTVSPGAALGIVQTILLAAQSSSFIVVRCLTRGGMPHRDVVVFPGKITTLHTPDTCLKFKGNRQSGTHFSSNERVSCADAQTHRGTNARRAALSTKSSQRYSRKSGPCRIHEQLFRTQRRALQSWTLVSSDKLLPPPHGIWCQKEVPQSSVFSFCRLLSFIHFSSKFLSIVHNTIWRQHFLHQ